MIEDFTQHEYKGLLYNLYIPKNKEEGVKYPLVLFIPDASVNGPVTKAALVQGIGATIWAEPEEQAKRPCYVLALQLTTMPQDGGVEKTPLLTLTKELIDKLISEEDIDPKRIYTTGQSQGCTSSMRLNVAYPDLFAASLLVSGQHDADEMLKVKDKDFFIGLSEGGPFEFPGMNAVTEDFEKAGRKVIRVKLDFRDGIAANDDKIREADDGESVIYAMWNKDTIWPDDGIQRPAMAHHWRGWELTYQLESAREWLFRHHL